MCYFMEKFVLHYFFTIIYFLYVKKRYKYILYRNIAKSVIFHNFIIFVSNIYFDKLIILFIVERFVRSLFFRDFWWRTPFAPILLFLNNSGELRLFVFSLFLFFVKNIYLLRKIHFTNKN